MKRYKDMTDREKANYDAKHALMQDWLVGGAMYRMDYYDRQPKEIRDKMKEKTND